ncbi:Homoserine O-succinyltransferase [Frankliniella fusca]|uniref:Homoserine O-succinyltransferase n=1 Tax=Frankliniella fusca TaxID=407009 RepID=A0AAE1L662_9NEOP|nr:Homoserine O-succinyltransferase [Frankliniella fusca]
MDLWRCPRHGLGLGIPRDSAALQVPPRRAARSSPWKLFLEGPFLLRNYGLILCTNMSKETLLQLQKVQNSCVRFVFGAKKSDHVTPLYSKLGWLKVEDRQVLAIALLMWKIHKYQAPVYLFEMFSFNSNLTTRSNINNIKQPIPRTEIFKNSFISRSGIRRFS